MKTSSNIKEIPVRQSAGTIPSLFTQIPGLIAGASAEAKSSRAPKDEAAAPDPAAEKAVLFDAILKKANEYFSRNHVQVACDFLELLDGFDGHTTETLQTLGNLYFLLGDFISARLAFERALSRSPNHAGLHVCLAATNRCLDDDLSFEHCLTRALDLDSENLDALKLLADWHRDNHRYQDALEVYAGLAGQHQDRVGIFLSLAICQFRLGDRNEARSFLEKALAIDPANEIARENLALIDLHPPGAAGQLPVQGRMDASLSSIAPARQSGCQQS